MKYQLTITFESDRPLTQREQDQLLGAAMVQVEEPEDLDTHTDADYTTRFVNGELDTITTIL